MKNGMLLVFALPLLSLPLAAQTVVYNFAVPTAGPGVGYAPNGNLLSYTDSANGNWTMLYDPLNRLQSAAVTTGPYDGLGLALTYDSFGNRLTQTPSGPPSTGPVLTRWVHYDQNNRQTTTSGGSCLDPDGNNICYDAAGNIVFDLLNNMAYDGENRVCAVLANGTITQYLYDAEGRRVAKGHSASNPTALACSMGGTDFVPIETDVLGQSGEQITQFDGSGNWQHTNVYAAGQLLATYDTVGSNLHFHLADPLGSRRVQVSPATGVELNCANLPFGDNQSCSGSGTDATEHHFTGKERDAESGLDYFGARYYSSTMGRFLSPDWSARGEPVPYAKLDNPQSLNLYSYVGNNPLSLVDGDGHDEETGEEANRYKGGDASALTDGTPEGNASYAAFIGWSQGAAQERAVEWAQLQSSNASDKNTSVMLSADSIPPKPSHAGVQSQMDYNIVPQANTMTELSSKLANLSDSTKDSYSKMEVRLYESQRGGIWKWFGDAIRGSGHDQLNMFAGYVDQKWYIDGKRAQLVVGKDSSGNLIKAWTVHVVLTNSGPQFSKTD